MERKGFIGGSDCVKIMNGDWLELWQIKTGRVESDDLSRNIAVQLGSFTEDFNLKWFEQEHSCVLSGHQEEEGAPRVRSACGPSGKCFRQQSLVLLRPPLHQRRASAQIEDFNQTCTLCSSLT